MDIKPDNFLVKADNTIKLGDFGLAVDLNELESPNIKSREHTPKSKRRGGKNISEGDAAYLAPELLNFNAKVTKKVDVFSLGISLIECFNANNIQKMPQNGELWHKVREEKPSTFLKFPCQDLAELIDHMTEKDPNERFSIDDVLNNSYLKRLISDEAFMPSKNKVREKHS